MKENRYGAGWLGSIENYIERHYMERQWPSKKYNMIYNKITDLKFHLRGRGCKRDGFAILTKQYIIEIDNSTGRVH